MIQKYKYSDANIIKLEGATGTLDTIIPNPVIDVQKPAIFVLGGEYTLNQYNARTYARYIRDVLSANSISDIDIYSAYYSWGSRMAGIDRTYRFLAQGKDVDIDSRYIDNIANNIRQQNLQFEPVPMYAQKIFNQIFAPRIENAEHKRFNKRQLMQNTNALVWTHCQGAATMLYVQDILRDRMKSMGYKTSEIRDFQQNILVIQHEPAAPLGELEFNTVSFMAADDSTTCQHDIFSQQAKDYQTALRPSYFPQGNLFTAYRMRIDKISETLSEHNNLGMATPDYQTLSNDGKRIFQIQKNVLVRGAQAIKERKPVPAIQGLAGEDFFELQNNGYEFLTNAQIIARHGR